MEESNKRKEKTYLGSGKKKNRFISLCCLVILSVFGDFSVFSCTEINIYLKGFIQVKRYNIFARYGVGM